MRSLWVHHSACSQRLHRLHHATRALNFPTAVAARERNATPCCAFTDLPKITGLLTLRSRLYISEIISGRYSRTRIRLYRTFPNPVGAKEYRVRSVWEKVTSLSVSFEKRWWVHSSIPAATAADNLIIFLPPCLDKWFISTVTARQLWIPANYSVNDSQCYS